MKKFIVGIGIILITTTISCAPLTPEQQQRLFIASSALMSIGNTLQQQELINQNYWNNQNAYNQQQDLQMNYYQQQSMMNHQLQLMMLNQNR